MNGMLAMMPLATPVLGGVFAGIITNYLTSAIPLKRVGQWPVCDTCGEPIEWHRYLILHRRCKQCGMKIGISVSAIPIFYVALSCFFWTDPVLVLTYITTMILCIYLGVIALVDLRHRTIPDEACAFGLVFGLFAGSQLGHLHWREALYGSLAGFALTLGLYYSTLSIARMVSSWQIITPSDLPLRYQDAILFGILGMVLGTPGIFLAFILGAYGIIMTIFGYILLVVVQSDTKSFRPTTLPNTLFIILGSVVAMMLLHPV